MSLTRTQLTEHLLTIRPTLARQTVVSYVSILMNIFFEATREGNAVTIEPEWFGNHQEEVVEAIKSRPASSRATILSAVSVIINDKTKSELIRKELKKNVEETTKQAQSGVQTEKQQENWLSYEDVLGVWREYQHKANHIIKLPENLINEQIKLEFKKFILLSLTTGIYFPPRRSEWCKLKWTRYNQDTDNYIDFKNSKIVLNQYKTAKIFGRTEIDVPEELLEYIRQFIGAVNPKTEYLLSAVNGTPWINSRITKLLNDVFGRNISTSMLRHIYKTSRHMNMPALQQLQDEARAMGHGLKVSLTYIRNQPATDNT